ncbi:UBX domain-containing protein 11 [Rhinophrynus dorsalis]
MSSPLMTLGRSRKVRITPGQHLHDKWQKEEHGIVSEELMHNGEIHGMFPVGEWISGHHISPKGQKISACETSGVGRRAAPFKPLTGYKEEELFLLTSPPLHHMRVTDKGDPSLLGRGKQGECPVPSDFDLLSTTMKRVGELERKVRTQEQDIKLKEHEIATLEQKIKRLQRHTTESPTSGEHVQELEKRCKQLQQRVCEMERFLSDYGLVWVGEADSAAATPGQDSKTWNSGHSSLTTFQPDFDLILENLRDLNVLGGETQIEYQDRGARLRSPEPIPLTLYSNGIIMFRGPFRSYQEPSTQECLRDIMDGYFPSELQRRFPDGVTFQVTDKRNVVFRERRSWDEFPGSGQTVGSSEDALQEISEKPDMQLSVDQFLNKLPKFVVRRGQVLDIRGPVRETLQGSRPEEKSQEILVESPCVTSVEERSQEQMAVSTLRIRSETGEQTYKVRLLSSETLGDLRTYLSWCRAPDLSSYDIISQFPHRMYDDDTRTLEELGLIPNAFLLLRKKSVATHA